MKVNKVKIEVSLRQARMLARIIGAASTVLHDGTVEGWENQSKPWQMACDLENILYKGVADFCDELGFETTGWELAHKWGFEPMTKGFDSVLARKAVA